MSKLVIGYKNLIPGATVDAPGGSDPLFPVTNLQESDLFLTWHSTTLSIQTLAADFGAIPAEEIRIVAAIGTNLTDDVSGIIYTDDNSGMSSPTTSTNTVFDTSRDNPLGYAAPAGRDLIYIAEENIAQRYMEQRILDNSNPDGFYRVALWWAGPIWAPATGKGFTWRDDTEYISGKARRKFALTWRYLLRADGAALKSILHKLAQTGRVYMVLQDEEPAQWHLEAMLCTIGQVQETPVDDYVQLSCVATEADY